MGIPKLNKWLTEKCSQESIRTCSLLEFQDKAVAVDISIYLYRFLSEDNFYEHLYIFFSLFRYYCMRPIFIFDGKAPVEKKATMQKRKREKQEATEEYSQLEQLLQSTEDPQKKAEILQKMSTIKRRTIKITWAHIDGAIELLQAFGFEYYLAPHEADQICIHLAVTGQVYAIVSDDMDMLISGAKRILRNLNIYQHKITLYDTTAILSDIKMTLNDFRETVVLAGTDYAMENDSLPIKKCFELFYEYKDANISMSFTEWLDSKKIIVLNDYQHICSLFDTQSIRCELEDFIQKNRLPKPPKLNIPEIQRIMSKHNFVFVP